MSRASGQSRPTLTKEELVATIQRSSLPTVIIEGDNDTIVFRPLEEKFEAINLSILPVGGREILLSIFDELVKSPPKSDIVFIADRDSWIYDNVPKQYQNDRLILTQGYSIENDVIADKQYTNLLSAPERVNFNAELETFTQWYCIVLSRHLRDRSHKICNHPNHVLDNEDFRLSSLKLSEDEEFPFELNKKIRSDQLLYIRGKSIMDLLIRNLSYPDRAVKHNFKSLLEQAGVFPGDRLIHIYRLISHLMGACSPI